MDLNWGMPVASADTWVGILAEVVLAVDENRVTHITVRRGLVLSRRFIVPVRHLKRWDHEGLYLNVPVSEVLDLPKLPLEGGTGPAANLSPRTRIVLDDRTGLRLKGLRLERQDSSLTHLIVARPGLGRRSLLLPLDRIIELGSARIALDLETADLIGFPDYRLDRDIKGDVWEALYASEQMSQVDLKGIRVHVVDGLVALEGNVRTSSVARQAVAIAASVSGVAGTDDRLVSDWEIDLAVASYVSKQVPEYSAGIVVHTQLGTVILEGHLSSDQARDAIARGIRSIAGVRSVENLVDTPSPPPAPAPAASSAPEDGPAEEDADLPGGPTEQKSLGSLKTYL